MGIKRRGEVVQRTLYTSMKFFNNSLLLLVSPKNKFKKTCCVLSSAFIRKLQVSNSRVSLPRIRGQPFILFLDFCGG
jgi:hypothetical protein